MRTAMSNRRLRLAPHVRACSSDGQVILLDLRNNQYLGVGGTESNALADQIEGWPVSPESAGECATSVTLAALTQRLVSRGLLTHASSERLPDLRLVEASASLDVALADSGITARRLGRFLQSAATAALWLRCRSLHSIATAVAARRERQRIPAPDARSLEAMTSGTAAYERLRPFVFSAQHECLHDSLALVGFLATEGVFPRWVIGVRTRPFGAHSWVQSGGTVLNDLHENVRRFRPILVV